MLFLRNYILLLLSFVVIDASCKSKNSKRDGKPGELVVRKLPNDRSTVKGKPNNAATKNGDEEEEESGNRDKSSSFNNETVLEAFEDIEDQNGFYKEIREYIDTLSSEERLKLFAEIKEKYNTLAVMGNTELVNIMYMLTSQVCEDSDVLRHQMQNEGKIEVVCTVMRHQPWTAFKAGVPFLMRLALAQYFLMSGLPTMGSLAAHISAQLLLYLYSKSESSRLSKKFSNKASPTSSESQEGEEEKKKFF